MDEIVSGPPPLLASVAVFVALVLATSCSPALAVVGALSHAAGAAPGASLPCTLNWSVNIAVSTGVPPNLSSFSTLKKFVLNGLPTTACGVSESPIQPAGGAETRLSHCRKFGPTALPARLPHLVSHGGARQPMSSVGLICGRAAPAITSTCPYGWVTRYAPPISSPLRMRMRTRPMPPCVPSTTWSWSLTKIASWAATKMALSPIAASASYQNDSIGKLPGNATGAAGSGRSIVARHCGPSRQSSSCCPMASVYDDGKLPNAADGGSKSPTPAAWAGDATMAAVRAAAAKSAARDLSTGRFLLKKTCCESPAGRRSRGAGSAHTCLGATAHPRREIHGSGMHGASPRLPRQPRARTREVLRCCR